MPDQNSRQGRIGTAGGESKGGGGGGGGGGKSASWIIRGFRHGRRTASPSVLGRGDLATSLLLIFPLFLAYEVGVMFAPAQNGVDFVTRNLFALLGGSRSRYLLAHAIMAVVFVLLLAWLKRKNKIESGRFIPVLLESTLWALTLGSLIIFVMRRVLGIEPSLAMPPAGSTVERIANGIVLSLGAGVHEELVFRLGFCAGGAALMRALGASHAIAVVTAFLVSSLAFSAAHHIGHFGDPWVLSVFVYRFLAGLVFAALYYFRSLAHATYTHALYDLYVLVLR
ncbi:MAG: CPBP family intramembrane glutamic endopeptidase [Pseudomonadota bacterium]